MVDCGSKGKLFAAYSRGQSRLSHCTRVAVSLKPFDKAVDLSFANGIFFGKVSYYIGHFLALCRQLLVFCV